MRYVTLQRRGHQSRRRRCDVALIQNLGDRYLAVNGYCGCIGGKSVYHSLTVEHKIERIRIDRRILSLCYWAFLFHTSVSLARTMKLAGKPHTGFGPDLQVQIFEFFARRH